MNVCYKGLLGALMLMAVACQQAGESALTATQAPKQILTLADRDLDDIRKDGKLKALIVNSATSYFLYRGKPMGFEYELLTQLAEHLDLQLELQVEENLDSLIGHLRTGKADIVAHGLTITNDRKELAAFTDYLYLTKQVLVQKKPDNWRKISWASLQRSIIHDPIELIGDTVSVRANSSYLQRVANLSNELGGPIYIDTLPGDLATEEAIQMVVNGEIKYTVADDNLAKINASYYPVLDISVPMSFSQRIAWAVRPNSPALLSSINTWVKQQRKKVGYYVIYNRYYKNKRDFRKRVKSEFYAPGKNQISEYDDLLREYADTIQWDWRLLASLVYQESRFNPQAESWAGAQGLMQLMPATAKSMGVSDVTDPQDCIRGGTQYLDDLYGYFDEIPDSVQRLKFTMAAYNCGYFHVKDAQLLAKEEGKDPLIWDENVEEMILALSYPRNYNRPGIKYGYVRGIEPHTYVRQIFERYTHYLNFLDQPEEERS